MKLTSTIDSIESSKASFPLWAMSTFCIILVRNLLESLFEIQRLGLSSNFEDSVLRYLFHYPALYLGQAMVIVLIIHFIVGEKIERVARVVFSLLIVIWLPPVIDAFVSCGKGYPIGYFDSMSDLGRCLLYLAHPGVYFDAHISPGLRIELILCVCAACIYTAVKTGRVWKTVATGVLTYCVIPVVAGGLPILFAECSMRFATAPVSIQDQGPFRALVTCKSLLASPDQCMALLYSCVLLLCLGAYYYRYDRTKFMALLANMRPFRTAHYCGLMVAGLGVGYFAVPASRGYAFRGPADYVGALGLCLAGVLACQSAAIFNDLFDVESDRISNRDRPLVRGKLDRYEYGVIGVLFIVLALDFAYCVCYHSFLMVLTFWGVYFIYSAPPFRLKRFFPLNMCLVAVNAFVMFLAGLAVFGKSDTISLLTGRMVYVITVPYILGVNIITLKDIDADRGAGVCTLPVLLGEGWGKTVIAIMVFAGAVCVVPALGITWLYVPAILFGGVAGRLVLKERWNEKPFFCVYLAYFLVVAVACLLCET